MRAKRLRMVIARMVGRDRIRYPREDSIGNIIWVCTRCGAHFIGDNCPRRNCK